MSGKCATVTLSLGSIIALCGIVLVAIAFGTSTWRTFTVDEETESPNSPNEHLLYSRNYGFFKFCFVNHAPSNFPFELSRSPLGSQCGDISYNETVNDNNNDKQNTWIHMKRLYLGLYVAGLFLCLISILTLLAGCVRSSYSIVVLTAVLFMLAAFFIAAAIGVWHKFVLLDEEIIDAVGNFFNSFPPRGPAGILSVDGAIKAKTTRSFGWSYMLGWIGVGLLLLAAIFLFIAACLISWNKAYASQQMHDQHALVVPQAAYSNMAYEKGAHTYASPYAAAHGAQMAYHPAYGTYGYHTYNPYAYYYASHYYPYSSNTLR